MVQGGNNMYDSGMNYPHDPNIQVHTCGPGHHSPKRIWKTKGMQGLPAFSMLVIREGVCEIEDARGKTTRVLPGDMVVLRWDVPRTERNAGQGVLIAPWCSFDWRESELQTRKLQCAPQVQRRQLRDPEFVSSCMQRLIDAHILGDEKEAGVFASAVLLEFEKGLSHVKTSDTKWSHSIQQVCQRIQQCPEYGWSLSELAKEHACDPDHFARMFRRIIGVSPGKYVIRCRMQRARYLLRHTDDKMAILAEALGYCDPYAFSKQFKKHVGVSPRDFRNG